jgi:hypothetical protein
LLPQQTIEEQLSLAHVQAIAAQAGVSMSYFNLDYGFDGTFRPIRTRGSRYVTVFSPIIALVTEANFYWSIDMIEQNPNIELNLCKQDVERYLLTHGWYQVEHPNKKLKVFDGVLDDEGQPFRLVLPMNERTRDTTLRIYQAVQTIAGVEDRSIAAVAADIQKLHGDNAAIKPDEALSGK